MRALLTAFALSLLLAQPVLAADDATAPTEINYLLEFVASSGCTFTRNGDGHPSAEAAEHLRLKYRRGKHYASTAEQFIDRLATESSWSGDPYTVTCKGATQPSSQWLHRALTDYRKAQQETSTP